jgi:hypothetical protein
MSTGQRFQKSFSQKLLNNKNSSHRIYYMGKIKVEPVRPAVPAIASCDGWEPVEGSNGFSFSTGDFKYILKRGNYENRLSMY